MAYVIEAPNRQFTGVVVGVAFRNGASEQVSQVDDYFARHGYTVTEVHEAKPKTVRKTTK